MNVSGVVASVQKFGAFIDLGGIQALLPVSEMGWGRVDDPKVLYSPATRLKLLSLILTGKVIALPYRPKQPYLIRGMRLLESTPKEAC